MPDLPENPDFFVPAEHRKPSREYVEVIESQLPPRWRLFPSHFWTQVSGPMPMEKIQGWKIHVSATIAAAKELLQRVAVICWDVNTEFKFASDSYVHHLLLSKIVGRQSGGKFITIYPATDDLFDALLDRLYVDLKSFDGPYILSDRQYKDSKVVFYRYGGFQALNQVDVYGQSKSCILGENYDYIEDQRLARFVLPSFVTDRHAPPPPMARPEEASEATANTSGAPARLFGEFFEIQRFIKYSNAGGVYQGRDVRDDSVVIVKEARPHCSYGEEGMDAMAQLRSEYAVLQRIAYLGVAPMPLAQFQVWEHLFLVLEQVQGVNLQDYMARNSMVIQPGAEVGALRDWFQTVTTIAVDLLKLLHQLHENGVVYGDLSPNNVLIDEATMRVRLIDFEAAFLEGVGSAPNIFTPGFARPDRQENQRAGRLDDQYALGCLMMYMFAPSQLNMDLMPDYVELALAMLGADYRLPPEYGHCIRQLLQPEPVDLAQLAERLARSSCEGVRSLPVDVPSEFSAYLPSLREDCLRYIHAHATPDGGWQVFPVDTDQIYQLSFDYGVLGTLYALQRIQGRLPDDLRDWLLRACRQAEPLPGLLNGAAGAAWLLHQLGCPEEAARQLRWAGLHRLLFTNASLGYGSAGLGLALLQGWLHTGDQDLLTRAIHLADILCDTALKAEAGWSWDVNGEGGVRLGLHSGASGVALFLLHAFAASGEERHLAAAKAGLAFDMSHCQPSGMPATYVPERPARILSPYLAAGTAGVAMVALRLYAITADPHYLPFIDGAKALTAQKYTVCGGLAEGLAGLGHFLLDLEDWLGDAEAGALALRAAHGMTLSLVRRREGLTAPARLGSTVSVSYLSGSAGMALFLHRLIEGGGAFHFTLDGLLRGKASVQSQPPRLEALAAR